jgi:hypothetical protein
MGKQMNITAINTLAETLENLPPEKKTGFNMGTYVQNVSDDWVDAYKTNTAHECGTVACIAGWAALHLRDDGTGLLKQSRRPAEIASYDVMARHILGIDERTADSLFEPMNFEFDDQDLTRSTMSSK